MSRKVHGGRSLLNLSGHHSTAAIVAEVPDTSVGNWDNAAHPDAVCKITDCDGSISLDMDYATANQLENSVHKIDVMIETLIDFRRGLIHEHHRLQSRIVHVQPADLPWSLRNCKHKRSTLEPRKGWQHRA